MKIVENTRLKRWQSYVDLANFLAISSLKREARESVLSYSWWVLEPLSQLLLFYVAFGVLMKASSDNFHFLAILFCGIVSWRWFSTGVTLGASSLLRNGLFLKSFKLPTIVFVLSAFFESVVRILPIFLMMLAYLLILNPDTWLNLGWLVFVVGAQVLFMLALTTMLSWISVFIPDLMNLLDIGLRAGLFLSGVFYATSNLSTNHQAIMFLNPMAVIIDSYRSVLVNGGTPHTTRLAVIIGISLIVILVNYIIHRRLAGRLASMLN